jgi:AGZA family xanthine/uracil permease-like MFS transporter
MASKYAGPEFIDKYFKVTERGSNLLTEWRAGTATFLTLCYILPVNARLLSESGGPCTCSAATAKDFACRFYDDQYNQCVEDFRRELITATAVSAAIACFLMGTVAKLPFAIAPGMGLNAYFTYNVVGYRGTGMVPWKAAITCVFFEGLVFLALSITGLRIKFAKAIPTSIKLATTGGIGFFLAHLGLQTAEGIGLVVTDVATGLTLGGCPAGNRSYAVYGPQAYLPKCVEDLKATPIKTCPTIAGAVTADAYTCDNAPSTVLTSPTTWLGICTIFIIAILLKRGVRGAIITGVMFATFISWIPNTGVSYWSDDVYPLAGGAGLGGGKYRWDYFKNVVKVEGINKAGAQFDFNWSGNSMIGIAFFTFLYVDIFDCTGTLYAMAKFANLLDKNGDFEGSTAAFCVDSASISIGALLGTSPLTVYIESAPGIEEGGRTGVCVLCTCVIQGEF